MSTYSANGSAHRILTRLALGPATMPEMRQASAAETGRDRKKVWHRIQSMLAADLIARDGAEFVITATGFEALAVLDSGHDFTAATPSVRVFARAA